MSARPQAPTLPYDVQLDIINILLDEYECEPDLRTYTLKAFSFISRPMLIFCQKRLFRRYTIGHRDPQNCALILLHSPHLKAYVKELWVSPMTSSRWIVHILPADMRIIRLLTSLNRIGVEVDRHWRSLPFCLHRTIVDLILVQKVTSLYFRGVSGLPLPFFALLGSLKTLEVRDANPDPIYDHYDDMAGSDDSDTDSEDQDAAEAFERLSLSEQPSIPSNHVSESTGLEKLSIIDSDKVLLYLLLLPNDMLEERRRPLYGVDHSSSAQDQNDDNDEELDENDSDLNVNSEPEESDSESDEEDNDKPEVDRCDHYTPLFSDYSSGYPTQYRFQFSRLRALIVDITPNNLRHVWRIIYEARNRLVHLDIRERFRCRSFKDAFGFYPAKLSEISSVILPEEISLAPLATLQELSITIIIRDPPQMPVPVRPQSLCSWCSLLRTAPRGIRSLDITLDAFYLCEVEHLAAYFAFPDETDTDGNPLPVFFSSLDEIMSSGDYFPSLQSVCINVLLPTTDNVQDCSDREFVTDVIDEEDLDEFQAWEAAHNIDTSPRQDDNLKDDGTESSTGSDESDSSEISRLYGPFFTMSDDSRLSQDHLIEIEDVKDSLAYMFSRTLERFNSTNSFRIWVETDVHGYLHR